MIDGLKRSSFFAGFDDKSLADIAAFAHPMTFEPGQIIFDRDEEGGAAYIILKGRVRQGFEVSPGSEVWFLTGEPGDLFGFGSLIAPRVRAMRAKASEQTEVVALDADALLEYLEAHPHFGFIFMERLAQVIYQRLNNSRLQIIHLMPEREAPGPTL
ncbi:MAG: Crp/Fnr family transcriptional regulator [Gemmatimonadales bacterium]|jgi:CRP/FNR family transcriptional regulator/CRP/FNR family cyclic AMP-dependent transcriptional regulator